MLPLPFSALARYSAGDLAEGGVVAGDVGVLRAGVGQAAVHHRHVDALVLDLRDRLGQRRRLEREDHQRVDLGRRSAGPAAGSPARERFAAVLTVTFRPGVLLLELLLGLVGPENDAGGEAVGGGRN